MVSSQVMLTVNDAPVAINNFVRGYIDHVMGGILASLKDIGKIKSVDVSIEGDQISMVVNNKAVTLNPFVTRTIHGTIVGMISSLKGVSAVEKIAVSIKS
ncbi:MAG: hypothetical protein JXA50_11925 [Deltaproteobacteria bacterium]|nr:hypothetical protein [Deltaproteobacteria bacterium]